METEDCNDACALSKACNFKDFRCGTCAYGCLDGWVGDDYCDSACLNEEC